MTNKSENRIVWRHYVKNSQLRISEGQKQYLLLVVQQVRRNIRTLNNFIILMILFVSKNL